MKLRLRIIWLIGFLLLQIKLPVHAADHEPAAPRLRIPDKTWCLVIDTKTLTIKEKQFDAAGSSAKLLAYDEKSALIISVFLEPAQSPGDSKAVRTFYWEKAKASPLPKKNIRQSMRGDRALVEHMVPEFQGQKLNQQNLNAYFVIDDYWVDVHISKVDFKKADQKAFDELLEKVSVKRDEAPTTLELFDFGNHFYFKKDYKRARELYEQCLAAEKIAQKLDQTRWRILVDNLGMAYGIGGESARAKEMFEYGLSKDPKYAMFLYNLACTYAEMGDAKNALMQLERAFMNRDSLAPSERLPDAANDSSFRSLKHDKEFQALLARFPRKP